MNDGHATIDFTLYVAGDAPNSTRAVANLRALCHRHLPERHRIEIVDVFEHPRLALDEGILLTPCLVITSASPVLTVVGDLSEPSPVLRALGVESQTP